MYKIEIKNGSRKSYSFKDELKQEQFSFTKTGKYTGVWSKTVTEDGEAKQYKKHFASKGLRVIYFSEKEERSSQYRELYFRTHPPKIFNYYICSYCSKLLKEEDADVDHIIPIDKVKKHEFLRKVIKLLKWSSINDERNLTIACSRCNRKKSTKAGFWIVRGFLGQKTMYWFLYYTLKISVFVLMIAAFYYIIKG